LIPRTNRGILCINELPDLAEKAQVGLFNLMEENDIQIRGYRIRLPLDIFLVASANPEDYTNRGRITTPLKDRYGAQIRTHYPATIEDELSIMEMEWRQFGGNEFEHYVPQYMKEIVAEVTHLARQSPDINQQSGVSVRVSIANYETVVSNAVRRAVILGEKLAVPRISDLPYIRWSTIGKIELESLDAIGDIEVKSLDTSGNMELESLEETKDTEEKIIGDLIKRAVLNVFNRYYNLDMLEAIVEQFSDGFGVEISDTMSAKSYMRIVKEMEGLTEVIKAASDSKGPEAIASAVEFILEGLHVNKRLNKNRSEGKTVYKR